MSTKLLYLYDSYLREFEAKVQQASGNQVILDQTVFHPLTGGVACDTGCLIREDRRHRVTRVEIGKETKEIVHLLEEEGSLRQGDVVRGVLDWERRYRLMRLHTAAHLLAAIMYKDYNALVTGGQIDYEYARLDFNLPRTDRQVFEAVFQKVNQEVDKRTGLKIFFLTREEALRVPGIVKLAERMPPQESELRIVEIPGIDVQADGGPHVGNTGEIGKIDLSKIENKGKNQRRVYFSVR